MTVRPPISLLKQLLTYDSDEGIIRWRVKPGLRANAGDLAGTRHPDRRIYISVKGRAYPAHDLAWALAHGEYPAATIRFLDGDPSNLRLANMVDRGAVADRASEQENALALERRQRIEIPDVIERGTGISHVPGVEWHEGGKYARLTVKRGWSVSVYRRSWRAYHWSWIGIAGGLSQAAAEKMALDILDNTAWLETHPPSPLPEPLRRVPTTARGPLLGELYDWFAYRPDTGAILKRVEQERGLRADYVQPNGIRVVPFRTRYFNARRLAWLLYRHEWVDARDIAWREPPDPARDDENRAGNLVHLSALFDETPAERPPRRFYGKASA